MSYLARADEERQRIKDEEPERHAAETARVRAELALCLEIAAWGHWIAKDTRP